MNHCKQPRNFAS